MLRTTIKMEVDVQLKTATGVVHMPFNSLCRVSKVFANICQYEDVTHWSLEDFSHVSILQFVEFVSTFSHLDIKLPTKIDPEKTFAEHVGPVADFLQSKSPQECIELLLLANYVQYDVLFQLGCLWLASILSIPQHAAMAHLFGLPLTVPSDAMIASFT